MLFPWALHLLSVKAEPPFFSGCDLGPMQRSRTGQFHSTLHKTARVLQKADENNALLRQEVHLELPAKTGRAHANNEKYSMGVPANAPVSIYIYVSLPGNKKDTAHVLVPELSTPAVTRGPVVPTQCQLPRPQDGDSARGPGGGF